MSRNLRQRIAKSAEEYAQHIAEISTENSIRTKNDADLFVLDRSGSQSSRKRSAKELRDQQAGGIKSILSKTERKLVEKANRKLNAGKGDTSTSNDVRTSSGLKDLWSSEAESMTTAGVSKQVTAKRRATRVAAAGQSYNPSYDAHQDVVAEALAMEIRKRSRDDSIAIPASAPSALVESVTLVEESDPDESDEDEDEEKGDDETFGDLKKRRRLKERVTRAERNKRKARRLVELQAGSLKAEKALLKSIDSLPVVLKEVEVEESRREALRAVRKAQKQVAEEKGALSYEEAGLIPLSDELRGSLRTIIPKGCAVKSQTANMRENGDLMVPNKRKRRAFEKPHAAKNIKWHAKYKY